MNAELKTVPELRLAKDFTLPLDALALRIAILATSGSGKTNTAVVVVEEYLDEQGQVVVIDPQGDWWGLRSSADGKHDGYPVVVMGGAHGDVPLSPHAGKLVADLVVDERLSVVLDTSEFSNEEHHRFATEFAEQLFRRKNTDTAPILLVCEEAEAVAPQVLTEKGFEIRMLGIFQRIAKRGRRRGIFLMVVSQRTQDVNKKFLSQCRALVALRTTWAPDRKVIDEWASGYDSGDARSVLKRELAGLDTGEAWVWIPEMRIFRKVKIRKRRTFDSSETPTHGGERAEPKRLAPVDLERIKEKIIALREEAVASDPEELRAQLRQKGVTIAHLEGELGGANQRIDDLSGEIDRAARMLNEFEARNRELEGMTIKLDPAVIERLEAVCRDFGSAETGLAAIIRDLREARNTLPPMKSVPLTEHRIGDPDHWQVAAPLPIRQPHSTPPVKSSIAYQPVGTVADQIIGPRPPAPARAVHSVPKPSASSRPEGSLSGKQQRILDSLAWFENVRVIAVPKNRLAFMVGVSPKSSGYDNNLGALRSAGLIEYPMDKHVALTNDGRRLVNVLPVPPNSYALQQEILKGLPTKQAEILGALLKHRQGMTKEELAQRVNVSPNSSGFDNNIGALRSLGFVEKRAYKVTDAMYL